MKLGTPGVVAACLLGAVLLLAAYAKAIDPHGFAVRLGDVVPVPDAIAYPGALVIVAFEAGLRPALLCGSPPPPPLLLPTPTFPAVVGLRAGQPVPPAGGGGGR